jgi:FxsC-like protein
MAVPGRDAYFYLSHVRAPSMVVDHWAQKFFDDLCDAVRGFTRRNLELDIGFGDFQPAGPDRDAEIDRAVAAARVFVPLYSPEYLDSPPRDHELFRDRLRAANLTETGSILPVIWAPVPRGRSSPELQTALELGGDLPDYAMHGLSVMCRLKTHAETYYLVVQRLAERIVKEAQVPLPAVGAARSSAGTAAHPDAERQYIVAVIAPSENRMPPRRQNICYGSRSIAWRPFRNRQSLPIAEYTAQLARNMMMPTQVVDFASGDNRLDTSPGVILIDPWVLDLDGGKALLRAAFDALRQWVALVVVIDHYDPQYEAAATRADLVIRMGASSAGHKVVRDVREFEQQIGKLIGRTRRQFLNKPPTQLSVPTDPDPEVDR